MEKKVQESMVRVKRASACASKGGLKKGYACETPAGVDGATAGINYA